MAIFTRRILVTASSMRDIGHGAVLSQFLQILDEFAIVIGDHHHVHAGVDGNADRGFIILGDLVDGVVVGDEKALEADLVLQNLGQQVFRAGYFDAVPTVVGRHDGSDARGNGGEIALHVNAAQRCFVDAGVALIQKFLSWTTGAEAGAAIAHIMFGAGQNGVRIGETFALEAADGGCAQLRYQLGIFREAFIGAAPTDVLRDRHAGREDPLDTGGSHFLGGDFADLLDQGGVARRAQADVLREDHGAQDVVMSVNGVDAVEQGDF